MILQQNRFYFVLLTGYVRLLFLSVIYSRTLLSATRMFPKIPYRQLNGCIMQYMHFIRSAPSVIRFSLAKLSVQGRKYFCSLFCDHKMKCVRSAKIAPFVTFVSSQCKFPRYDLPYFMV